MFKLLDTRYHHGDGFEGFTESSCLSIYSIVLLVVFVVVSIIYATWIFIDASGISNIAGVHITKNILLEVENIKGNLYTDEGRGIKDWMIHTDRVNGFELKHPNNWEMQGDQKDGALLLLKTYKSDDKNKSSLLMTVEVRSVDDLQTGKASRDIINQEGFIWQDNWKKEEVNGRMATRTGKTKTIGGPIKDAVFWENAPNQKGFYLEATYFTDDINDAKYNEDVFNNVISEFKFL